MSKVTILTKPNRIVIASKGVQGPPGPQGEQGPPGSGDGLPDAPSDGNTYGRKDGEWAAVEEVAAPTLQEVLDEGNTGNKEIVLSLDEAPGLQATYGPVGMNFETPAGVSGFVGASFFWQSGGDSLALGPAVNPPTESHEILIPQASGTILLDSDIGTLVAAADAIPVWVEITQAAYDALDPPDPNTLYVVID